MTLPDEEVRALKQTAKFMSSLLQATWSWRYFGFLALSRKARGRLRESVASCLRHYPFDCTIDERWGEQ